MRGSVLRAGFFSGFSTAVAAISLVLAPMTGVAQGTDAAFGGFKHDNTLPVEVTADSLRIEQATGVALFSGSVLVGQGSLRLQADSVEVTYARDGGDGGSTGAIEGVKAIGNVTMTNGGEAAEAETATYDVKTGDVLMEGDVLLTQGQNALSGQKLRIDLNTGIAQMEGRVQTIFQPAAQE